MHRHVPGQRRPCRRQQPHPSNRSRPDSSAPTENRSAPPPPGSPARAATTPPPHAIPAADRSRKSDRTVGTSFWKPQVALPEIRWQLLHRLPRHNCRPDRRPAAMPPAPGHRHTAPNLRPRPLPCIPNPSSHTRCPSGPTLHTWNDFSFASLEKNCRRASRTRAPAAAESSPPRGSAPLPAHRCPR